MSPPIPDRAVQHVHGLSVGYQGFLFLGPLPPLGGSSRCGLGHGLSPPPGSEVPARPAAAGRFLHALPLVVPRRG
eukprot:14740390-Alexandrium_andersonii.AAC.1